MLIPHHTVYRAHGTAIWVGPEGKPVEKDTLQCQHCQRHWFVEPGSGRHRGWCLKCGGPTCGGRKCLACVPFLKKVEGEAAW